MLFRSSNRIKSLPAQLSTLKKIRYLDVSDNQIEKIHVNLSTFTELTFFDVSDNCFTELSSAFARYDNRLRGFDLKETAYQYTGEEKGHDLMYNQADRSEVDWDSHFNLESLVTRENFKSDISEGEYEDRDEYLEQKFLLIDF